MIRIYISLILKFFKSIGNPNYISTSSLLMCFVILGYLGTLLNLAEFNIRKMSKIFTIGIPLALFVLIYVLLSKDRMAETFLNKYENLNYKEKIIYGILSILFSIVSFICFLRTSNQQVKLTTTTHKRQAHKARVIEKKI